MRPFVPLEPGRASVYLCGATVQAPPHIGHIRSGIAFDVLQRWLETGLTVTFIRNVTDIDDKILANAQDEGVPFWQVAARNERAFSWAYDVLGCLAPTVRAAGDRARHRDGRADGAADRARPRVRGGRRRVLRRAVVAPVRRSSAGSGIDEMLPAADSVSTRQARPARLRALEGAPSRASRRGRRRGDAAGRAGTWSARRWRTRYLGPAFDIHGGGLDLVFPHHENELAQSRAAGDALRAVLDAQRVGHHVRREDEQVAGQQPAGVRGRATGTPRRAALLPRSRRTTAATSSTPRQRCWRRRPHIGASKGS